MVGVSLDLRLGFEEAHAERATDYIRKEADALAMTAAYDRNRDEDVEVDLCASVARKSLSPTRRGTASRRR